MWVWMGMDGDGWGWMGMDGYGCIILYRYTIYLGSL
jgi:hypothetical protein